MPPHQSLPNMQFVHQEREREREREREYRKSINKNRDQTQNFVLKTESLYIPLMYHLQLWTQKHDSQFEDWKIKENVGLGEENCKLFVWLLDINIVEDLSTS